MNRLTLITLTLLVFFSCKPTHKPPVKPPAPQGLSNEDCLPFDYNKLEIIGGPRTFTVTDGRSRMMIFRDRNTAQRAIDVIQHYKMDKQCFATRPDPALRYFTVKSDIPSGNLSGEDCIYISSPDKLVIHEKSPTSFSIVHDGFNIPFNAKTRVEAERVIEIIRAYGAKYTCYVGRPNAGMMYLRK